MATRIEDPGGFTRSVVYEVWVQRPDQGHWKCEPKRHPTVALAIGSVRDIRAESKYARTLKCRIYRATRSTLREEVGT